MVDYQFIYFNIFGIKISFCIIMSFNLKNQHFLDWEDSLSKIAIATRITVSIK